MPWKVSDTMSQRLTFISRLLQGESMSEVCREMGISRKTGYKFASRYERQGLTGLLDESKAPRRPARKTTGEIEGLIVGMRERYPSWGPKKIKAKLEGLHPGIKIPAASTIGCVLERHGLIQSRSSRRVKLDYEPSELTQSTEPNQIWCVDFKGQFRLGDQSYCYPLTVTDHFSRYILACEALENVKSPGAKVIFEELFHHYGLPKIIRSDNGGPFASSTGLYRLTKLSAWWLKLGIRLERIEPGCPEQNGRHERMHLTLKREATRPPKKTLMQQQECFDHFCQIYNFQRPHEALGQKTPSEFYTASDRKFAGTPVELEYPLHDFKRRVDHRGFIHFFGQGRRIFVSRALMGDHVGVRQLDPEHWLVTYADLDLGCFSTKTFKFSDQLPSEVPEETS